MAKSRDISTLRARLILETYVPLAGSGTPLRREWQSLTTVWASIETVEADQRVNAGQISQNLTHRVAIRYRSDVDTSNRFRFGERIFFIRNVFDEDGRRRWLICLCEELRA